MKYEDEHLVYEKLKENNGNFKDYIIKVKEKDADLINYIEDLIDNEDIYLEEFNGMKGIKKMYILIDIFFSHYYVKVIKLQLYQ